MKEVAKYLVIKKESYLYWIAFLLLFPALFINLGKMPLLADEPTRALVAQEIYFSGNYIVPTINGEYYYNKPPLYNWFLVGLYKVSGSMDEWLVRFPTVGAIFLFAFIIFAYVRKYSGTKAAVFTILAYVTCGRVLFYDSFLGLIDTLFSALIFLNFMIVYHYDKKNDYVRLFLISYLITIVCYFLKGLPALVFEAVTLLTFALMRKKFKLLFSWPHFAGIGLFLVIVVLYYSQYLRYNTLDILLKTLVSESTKRTAAEHGIGESILHLLTFPFEMILHFLPWTAPLLLLLKKENRRYVMENDFLRYNLYMVLANIIVYWLSPETRPRYLFMFLPPLFILTFSLVYAQPNFSFRKIMEKVLLVLAVVITIAPLAIPFINAIPQVEYKLLKITVLFAALLLALVYYIKNADQRLLLFGMILLIARIGFNWFVFPARLETEPQIAYRKDATYVGRLTKGSPLYLYKYTPANHDISYYICRERQTILEHSFKAPEKQAFYLTTEIWPEFENAKIYYQFHIGYNNTLLYLVRIE